MRNRFDDEGYRGEGDRDRGNEQRERSDRGQSLGHDRERHFGGYDSDRPEWERRDRAEDRNAFGARARQYPTSSMGMGGPPFDGNYGGGHHYDRFRGSSVDNVESHLSQPGYYGERWGESRWGSERTHDDHRHHAQHSHHGHHEGEGIGERVMHGLRDGMRSIFGKTAKGPKGYSRSDERVREDVCDRLSHLSVHADVDASDVEVMVKDGEVTLTGTVPERRWKHMIEDTAASVHGVKDVHNTLKVRRETEMSGRGGPTTGASSGQASQASHTGQTDLTSTSNVENGSRRNMPHRS